MITLHRGLEQHFWMNYPFKKCFWQTHMESASASDKFTQNVTLIIYKLYSNKIIFAFS